MSYSTLYRVFNKSVQAVEKYSNGYGTGRVMWEFMAAKYLPSGFRFGCFCDDMSRLWDLSQNAQVPEHHRIAHAFTFDRGVVLKADFKTLVDALEKTARDVSAHAPECVCHWSAIARDVAALANEKQDYRLRGVALNCTSVEDVWDGGSCPVDMDCFDVIRYARNVRSA